jgi:predicted DsbA family dithiol-disulfide isomerase
MQVEIDLFSDFICPWSYIGKRQFDAAVSSFADDRPDVEVRVRWTPYFLDPSIPPQGLPFRKSLTAKAGEEAAADAMLAQVREAGRNAGIDFALERIAVLPNTLRAHRLIYKTQTDGLSPTTLNQLVEGIFSAYFSHGENIGDPLVLGRIARACGREEAPVLSYLLADDDVEAVNALARLGGAMGIGGVPCFVFNRDFVLSGAQPAAVLVEAMHDCVVGRQAMDGLE